MVTTAQPVDICALPKVDICAPRKAVLALLYWVPRSVQPKLCHGIHFAQKRLIKEVVENALLFAKRSRRFCFLGSLLLWQRRLFFWY